MANPQLENGHTQIANEILEQLAKVHLSPNQWQVVLFIIRKTYGFKRKVDYIANCQIVEGTELVKEVVSRALRELQDRQIIIRKGKFVGFQKDYELWKLAESSIKVSSIVNNEPKVSSSVNQLDNKKLAISSTKLAESSIKVSNTANHKRKKETITKENKEINKESLPEYVDKEVWDAFIDMRKKIKSPPSDYAITLMMKTLERFRNSGDDPNEVLKQSIMNSWKGIFPLRNKTQVGKNPRALPKEYTDDGN